MSDLGYAPTALAAGLHVAVPPASTPPPISSAGHAQLLIAALLGILTVVLLIAVAKFHPRSSR